MHALVPDGCMDALPMMCMEFSRKELGGGGLGKNWGFWKIIYPRDTSKLLTKQRLISKAGV